MKVRVPRCKQCWGQRADLVDDDRLQCVECNERGPMDSAAIAFIKEIKKHFGHLGPIPEVIIRETRSELQRPAASAEEPALPRRCKKRQRNEQNSTN
jgi:hypothetical protein